MKICIISIKDDCIFIMSTPGELRNGFKLESILQQDTVKIFFILVLLLYQKNYWYIFGNMSCALFLLRHSVIY